MAFSYVLNPFSGNFDVIVSGSVTALAAIGSSPNANGATLSSGTLNLEPASASFGGVITTGTQTLAGAKTFSGDTLIANNAGSQATIGGSSSTAIHVLNGGLRVTQRSTTSNLTIDTTTTDYAVLVDTTGGAVTITMPAHASGRIVKIKDKGGAAETNNITVARNGGTGSIEGVAASKTLSTNYGSWTFISDGSSWWMI